MFLRAHNAFLSGIACVALLMSDNCYCSRKAEIVLIPNGYVGWVRISYDVKGEPPLQVQRCAYHIKVPGSGRVATSTPMENGYAQDQYYYVDEHEQLKLLTIADGVGYPAGTIRATRYFTIPTNENQRERHFRVFFVGTAADYHQARKDDDYLLSL